MEALPGLWSLSPVGFGLGIAALVIVAIVLGWLIPKRTHERELATERLRGDEWKATALEERRARLVSEAQNSSLIEANKVVEQLLRAAGPGFGETTQPGGST